MLAGKASLNLSSSTFSKIVDKQFKHLEYVLNNVIKQFNTNNDVLTKSIRILESEKNSLKIEIGKKDGSLHS